MRSRACAAAALFATATVLASGAAPPPQLCGGACGDGMVLARHGARLWGAPGSAPPRAPVSVSVDGAAPPLATTADGEGAWELALGEQAPRVNVTVVVTVGGSGGGVATIADAAFGDVFLCGGQSNLELPIDAVFNSSAILAEAATLGAGVRIMRVNHLSSPNVTTDVLHWDRDWAGDPVGCSDRCGAPWSRMLGAANASFSAICWLAAAEVFRATGGAVPLGLVEAAWGGTRIEAWTSADALGACPGLNTSGCGPCVVWQGGGAPAGGDAACPRMNSTNSGNLCSANTNGMLAPLRKMVFAAALFMQGESNMDEFQGALAGPLNYACRFPAAVADIRNLLGLADPPLPFFFVELAACDDYDANVQWGYIRTAQRAALLLPEVGFATAIDAGTRGGGVHSDQKQPVGHRLALHLLRRLYGRADLAVAGPVLAARPVAARPPGNASAPVQVRLVFAGATDAMQRAVPTMSTTCPLSHQTHHAPPPPLPMRSERDGLRKHDGQPPRLRRAALRARLCGWHLGGRGLRRCRWAGPRRHARRGRRGARGADRGALRMGELSAVRALQRRGRLRLARRAAGCALPLRTRRRLRLHAEHVRDRRGALRRRRTVLRGRRRGVRRGRRVHGRARRGLRADWLGKGRLAKLKDIYMYIRQAPIRHSNERTASLCPTRVRH